VRRLLVGCLVVALVIEVLAGLSWFDLGVPELAGWLALWGLLIAVTVGLALYLIGRRGPDGGEDGGGGSRRPDGDPPPWWPQFEREFWNHVEGHDRAPDPPPQRVPAGR
jgi:hypothetical protein